MYQLKDVIKLFQRPTGMTVRGGALTLGKNQTWKTDHSNNVSDPLTIQINTRTWDFVPKESMHSFQTQKLIMYLSSLSYPKGSACPSRRPSGWRRCSWSTRSTWPCGRTSTSTSAPGRSTTTGMRLQWLLDIETLLPKWSVRIFDHFQYSGWRVWMLKLYTCTIPIYT